MKCKNILDDGASKILTTYVDVGSKYFISRPRPKVGINIKILKQTYPIIRYARDCYIGQHSVIAHPIPCMLFAQ